VGERYEFPYSETWELLYSADQTEPTTTVIHWGSMSGTCTAIDTVSSVQQICLALTLTILLLEQNGIRMTVHPTTALEYHPKTSIVPLLRWQSTSVEGRVWG
jgi:hypothetical protein